MAARRPASSKASGDATVDHFMRALDHHRAAIKLRDRDDIAARRESLIQIVQHRIEPQ